MRKTLIGKFVKVVASSNQSVQGIEGKVVDETKNTLTIRKNSNEEKKLIKNQVTLDVEDQRIEGSKLTKRIEERIKK